MALVALAAVLVSLLECPGASGGGSPTAAMSTAPDEPDLDGRRRRLEEASGVLAALVALVAGTAGGGGPGAGGGGSPTAGTATAPDGPED